MNPSINKLKQKLNNLGNWNDGGRKGSVLWQCKGKGFKMVWIVREWIVSWKTKEEISQANSTYLYVYRGLEGRS